MENLAHILILIGLVVTSASVIWLRDLLAATVVLGAFSLLLALEFYLLQAPDVAIAEAGIGAGLTTAIYIIAIRGTRRQEGLDE
jgi:uncharacterized MnhB-related membrane protein